MIIVRVVANRNLHDVEHRILLEMTNEDDFFRGGTRRTVLVDV